MQSITQISWYMLTKCKALLSHFLYIIPAKVKDSVTQWGGYGQIPLLWSSFLIIFDIFETEFYCTLSASESGLGN